MERSLVFGVRLGMVCRPGKVRCRGTSYAANLSSSATSIRGLESLPVGQRQGGDCWTRYADISDE